MDKSNFPYPLIYWLTWNSKQQFIEIDSVRKIGMKFSQSVKTNYHRTRPYLFWVWQLHNNLHIKVATVHIAFSDILQDEVGQILNWTQFCVSWDNWSEETLSVKLFSLDGGKQMKNIYSLDNISLTQRNNNCIEYMPYRLNMLNPPTVKLKTNWWVWERCLGKGRAKQDMSLKQPMQVSIATLLAATTRHRHTDRIIGDTYYPYMYIYCQLWKEGRQGEKACYKH